MADIREFAQELVELTGEEMKRMTEAIDNLEYIKSQLSIASNPFAKSNEHRKKQIAKRRKKNKRKAS